MRGFLLPQNITIIKIMISSNSSKFRSKLFTKYNNNLSPNILMPFRSNDLIIYLDSTNKGNFQHSGGSVQTWYDLSGYNNHFVQNTVSQQPSINTNTKNGRRVVTFGNNDYMEATPNLDINCTIIMAYQPNSNGNEFDAVLGHGVSGTKTFEINAGSASGFFGRLDGLTGVDGTDARADSDFDGEYVVHTIRFDASTNGFILRLNGVEQDSQTSYINDIYTSAEPLRIGTGRGVTPSAFASPNMIGLLVYNTALDEDKIVISENYFLNIFDI